MPGIDSPHVGLDFRNVDYSSSTTGRPAAQTGLYADDPSGNDDTSRLQVALTAAMAAGKHLFLGPGPYTITKMLSVDGAGYSGGGFGMVGASDGSTTITGPAGGSDLEALLKIGVTNFAQRVTLRDLSISYPAGHTHTTGHIVLAATHLSVMDRVIATAAPQDAFHIANPFSSTQFLRMTRCEGWQSGRDGLFLANMTDAWVDSSIFSGLGTVASPKGRYGIYNQGFAIEYTNNWCYQNGTTGFFSDLGNGVRVRGGQYADNVSRGIDIANGSGIVLESIEGFDNPGGQYYVSNCSDVLIHHCTTGRVDGTYAYPTNAMLIWGCSFGSIHDNVLNGWSPAGQAMALQNGTTNFNVHDNVFMEAAGGGLGIFTQSLWCNFHDNQMATGILESAPGNHNHFTNNQMNGASVTVVGANSLAAGTW